jgi:hypothetical protein
MLKRRKGTERIAKGCNETSAKIGAGKSFLCVTPEPSLCLCVFLKHAVRVPTALFRTEGLSQSRDAYAMREVRPPSIVSVSPVM